MTLLKPIVVVQNNLVRKLTDPVARASHRLGIELWDVSSGDQVKTHPLPDKKERYPILVFGSVVFVTQWFSERDDLRKWGFFGNNKFDAKIWSIALGNIFLNHDGISSTVGDYGNSSFEAMHLRPRGEIKLHGDLVRDEDHHGRCSVPGGIMSPDAVRRLNIDPRIGIWLSPLKSIKAEVRVWMIGGVAVASSLYRYLGEMCVTTDSDWIDDAKQWAEAYHHRWHPARHYVVDLALDQEGSYKIIEYNPIHSSGWYAIDPEEVITAFMTYELNHIKT